MCLNPELLKNRWVKASWGWRLSQGLILTFSLINLPYRQNNHYITTGIQKTLVLHQDFLSIHHFNSLPQFYKKHQQNILPNFSWHATQINDFIATKWYINSGAGVNLIPRDWRENNTTSQITSLFHYWAQGGHWGDSVRPEFWSGWWPSV